MRYFEAQERQLQEIREGLSKIHERDPFSPVREYFEKYEGVEPKEGTVGQTRALNGKILTADSHIAYIHRVQSFEEIVDAAKSTVSPLRQYCPLKNPLLSSIDDLLSGVNDVLAAFNAIEKLLTHGQENDPEARLIEAAVISLKEKLDNSTFRSAITSTLAEEILGGTLTLYQDQLKTAFDEAFAVRNKLEEVHSNSTTFLASATTAVNEKLGLIREEYKKVSEVLAKLGTREQSVRFKEEADAQKDAANGWLAASVVILVVLIYYVLNEVSRSVSGNTLGEVIPATTAKLAIVTLTSVALSVSLRNYGACRHNMTVNRHREHALNTFDYFVTAASSDPETKNAVLIETTKVIFSPVNTGYLKSAQDSQGGLNLVEFVRHVSGGAEHK